MNVWEKVWWRVIEPVFAERNKNKFIVVNLVIVITGMTIGVILEKPEDRCKYSLLHPCKEQPVKPCP